MAVIGDIYQYMNQWAPFELQMDFDNAGFLVGRREAVVRRILVSLDITEEVVEEAAEQGCQLVVSHHPVIFHPARTVTDETVTGRIVLALAERKIGAICAHTNLDAVQDGVNDALFQVLELNNPQQLHQDGVDAKGAPYGIGRVGTVHQQGMRAGEYAAFVKERLHAASVRYVDSGKPVCKVAVGGGSCGSMLADAAAMGCDTFVTADVKHDQYLDAKAMGITLMDAGHYATENVVCPLIVSRLEQAFPEVEVLRSKRNCEPYQEA